MKKLIKSALLIGLIVVAVVLVQDIFTQAKKFDDISKVEKQASDLVKENESLKKSVSGAKNPLVLEEQARDKLGYQRPGETLYVTDMVDEEARAQQEKKANWNSWLDLFF